MVKVLPYKESAFEHTNFLVVAYISTFFRAAPGGRTGIIDYTGKGDI